MDAARILVVEDERIVAAGLRKRLQALGYEVPLPVTSGAEAVHQAGKMRPDLILMDIRLEGEMDGVEAATQIRSQLNIPVVYLTAYSNREVLERAKITEPYGYVLKPYEDRELHVVVEMALYKHRMDRAAHERERWLGAVLRSIGDGVVTTDGQGRITYLNPVAERLTGWSGTDAARRALEEIFHLVHEETREPVEAPLRQAMREQVSVPMANHTLLIARDATERPIDDCAAPILDGTMAPLGGVMVFRDVTERKLARERELASERFNQAVLDALPARIAVLDGAGAIIAVNERWAAFPDEGVGVNYLEVCRDATGAGDERTGVARQGIRAVLDGASARFSLEYACPSAGEERWFALTVVPLRHGQGRAIVVHTDVTDRKRAEEVASKLSAIVESSQDAIIGWSLDGTISSWNGGAGRLYGYTAAEVIGQPASLLFPPDCASEAPTLLEALRRGERAGPFETRRRRKDGMDVNVLVSVSPVRDGDGRVIGGASIAQDISQARRLEAQVRQAQKMEAIGRLAGGVAHDFNNLLTVINGYSQVLDGLLDQHAQARELVGQIARAGERAAALTQQLLAYSRKQIQQLKALDVNGVLAGLEQLLRRMVGEDVELVVVPGPEVCLVHADAGQLEQVVMNLAVNARDAMPTGGRLTIETRNILLEQALSGGLFQIPPGPYVLLAVTDSGCGMDAETQAHVFEPFFTTKAQGQGTGLGLAIVYGIVKQSEGYITVSSAPGRGTTFTIYLPGLKEPLAAEEPRHDAPPVRGGTETVLLVEDEDAVRELTRYLLEQSGYAVLMASSGAEALAIAAQHRGRIDLLVTDVVMPRMSGPQVAEALRATCPHLRVLYLSGYTDDAIFRHGLLGSETAFLEKPFTISTLTLKVRELLDQG